MSLEKIVVVEGTPEYDNYGNGYFKEWAILISDKDEPLDLLDIFRKTTLSNICEISDWHKCKIRLTVEVLEMP